MINLAQIPRNDATFIEPISIDGIYGYLLALLFIESRLLNHVLLPQYPMPCDV